MNVKEIKELINLMNDNGLLELEVEKEGMRIRLKKSSQGTDAFSGPIVFEKENISEPAPQKQAPEPAGEKVSPKTVEIRAPMVGTFYRAPAPEAAPYVEVGSTIEAGQVICVIEAMKLMNEIKSEIKGKILEILVDNAEPVEFGQPMFLIVPL